MITHNGLSVSIPASGYETEKTTGGLRIKPANWRSLRAPGEIEIETTAAAPAGEFPEQRRLGERSAMYRIDTASGGSGGMERTLHAYVSTDRGIIYLQQLVQTEDQADSDFDLGWQILGSARLDK